MSKHIFILDKIHTSNNNLVKLCNYDSNFTLDKLNNVLTLILNYLTSNYYHGHKI